MPLSKHLTGDFQQDVRISQNGAEAQVKRLILKKFNGSKIEVEKTDVPDFDFSFSWFGKEIKVEVKEDFRCKETGNVAVEVGKRGRTGGIHKSKSEWIIYKVHQNKHAIFVLYPTKMLAYRCSIGDYERKVKGGRNNVQDCCLFKFNDFIEKGIVIGKAKT